MSKHNRNKKAFAQKFLILLNKFKKEALFETDTNHFTKETYALLDSLNKEWQEFCFSSKLYRHSELFNIEAYTILAMFRGAKNEKKTREEVIVKQLAKAINSTKEKL